MRNERVISAFDSSLTPSEMAAYWPRDQRLMWLHSGRVHPRWARWSIMASPRAVFHFDGRSQLDGNLSAELEGVRLTHDPLRDLDAILTATSLDPSEVELADGTLPFRGGWIGCFSYDLGRVIEPRAQYRPLDGAFASGWPLIELAWCPDALVFDHVSLKWSSIESSEHDAHSRVATRPWRNKLMNAAARSEARDDFHLGEIAACIAPEVYESMVARTIEYIAAGDIFQANIAQRFRASFDGSTRGLAIDAFEYAQPWYGAYMELLPSRSLCCEGEGPGVRVRSTVDEPSRGSSHSSALPHPSPLPPATAAGGRGRCLLSLSPELFLHTNPLTRRVITRPIKGTRPASCDPRKLRDSRKDEAELNMIVDLMRNDLGRVCEYGSVRVTQPRMIESHPTVHHGVAEIAGRLRGGVSASDVLRATFPPGSVTGAPKIRAMQIIDELELAAVGNRGPYCGSIGFISDCGTMTLNVAIRTMLIEGDRDIGRFDRIRDGEISYSAGAGIVADSVPAREQQETLDKAAVLRAMAREESPVGR